MRKILLIVGACLFVIAVVVFCLSIKEEKELKTEQENIESLMEDVFVTGTAPSADTDTHTTTTDNTSSTVCSSTTTTSETQHTPATKPSTSAATTSQKPKQERPLAVNIDKLKKTNKDIAGWLYMENSNVNYPFLLSSGNEYIDKNIEGKTSKAGSIYCYETQKVSSINELDKNVVLYGHNMSNKTMFYYIDYLRQNPHRLKSGYNKYIYLYTEQNIYKYEIFSIYDTLKEDGFSQIYFKNDEEFEEFCKELYKKSNSKITDEDFEYSHILTLVTCTATTSKTHRSVLHARLVEVTENNY